MWKNSQKLLNILRHQKNIFFFRIYEMYLISAEGYKNADIHFLRVRKTGEIWVSMKNVHTGLVLKNIFDLVLKEIHGICETKNNTKEQIKKNTK